MKYLDLIIGALLLVLGAMAFARATKATDPAVRKREWIGTILCTIAGLIFLCLYIFSPPSGAGDRPPLSAEARP